MREFILRCDHPIGTKGNKCGEVVEDEAPFPFGLENISYEADLCEKHRDEMRRVMAKYIEIGRPMRAKTGNKVRAALKGRGGSTFTTKDVREWAQAQGREVPSSGRLPNDLIKEYQDSKR
jgi:hypothetical protein